MSSIVEKPSWQTVLPERDKAMTSLEVGKPEVALEYLEQMKLVIEDHFSLVTDRVERGESAPIEEAWLLGGITFPMLTYFTADREKLIERGLQPPEISQELIDFIAHHFPGFSSVVRHGPPRKNKKVLFFQNKKGVNQDFF